MGICFRLFWVSGKYPISERRGHCQGGFPDVQGERKMPQKRVKGQFEYKAQAEEDINA